MSTPATTICETPGCNSEARLQCPTCIKLGIKGSFFCSQECFKANWSQHKAVHSKSAPAQQQVIKAAAGAYNPWPSYRFTGQFYIFSSVVKMLMHALFLQDLFGLIPRHPGVLSQPILAGQTMPSMNYLSCHSFLLLPAHH